MPLSRRIISKICFLKRRIDFKLPSLTAFVNVTFFILNEIYQPHLILLFLASLSLTPCLYVTSKNISFFITQIVLLPAAFNKVTDHNHGNGFSFLNSFQLKTSMMWPSQNFLLYILEKNLVWHSPTFSYLTL